MSLERYVGFAFLLVLAAVALVTACSTEGDEGMGEDEPQLYDYHYYGR